VADNGVVEKLIVEVGYKLGVGSERAIKQSLASVKSLASEVNVAFGGLSAAIGGALVAVGGFALSVAQAEADIEDMAKALNTTTDVYTAYTYAATLSGLSTEKFSIGLDSLQRNLGAAGKGSADAQKLFQTLGVSFSDGKGGIKSAIDILPEIADGLKNISSEGGKTAVLFELFGKSGSRFKDLFSGGAEGLRELTKAAREKGFILSPEAAARGAELADNFDILKFTVSALGRTFADKLIPPLNILVEQTTAFLADSKGIVRSGLDKAAKTLAYAFEFLATDSGKAAAGIGLLSVAIGVGGATSGLLAALGPAGAAVAAFGGEVAAIAIPLALAAIVLEDFYVTAQGGDSITRRLADGLGIGDETARSFAASLQLLKQGAQITFIIFEEALLTLGDFTELIRTDLVSGLQSVESLLNSIGSKLGVNLQPAVGLVSGIRSTLGVKAGAGRFANFLENRVAAGQQGIDFLQGRSAPNALETSRLLRTNGVLGAGPLSFGNILANARDRNGAGLNGSQAAINVNVSLNSNREDIIRLVSEQAGRGVRAALAGVGDTE